MVSLLNCTEGAGILFCLYNATCMDVFRADHLSMDNHLMYSSPREGHISHPQLFSIACSSSCRVEALCFSLSGLSCSSVSSLFSSYLGSHDGKTLWVLLQMLLKDTISQETPRSSGPSIPSSTMFPGP